MSGTFYMKLRRLTIIGTKYFLATVLSLWLALWFNLPDLLSCGFVAVLTLQPNLYRGLKFSWEQIKATTIAALVTVAVVFLFGVNVAEAVPLVATGVAAAVTILVCLQLDFAEGNVVALFTVMYLFVLTEVMGQSFWGMIHLRYLTILVGIGAATVLNFISSLFRYQDRLYLNLVQSTEEVTKRVARAVEIINQMEPQNIRKDLLDEELSKYSPAFSSLRAIKEDLKEISREEKWKLGVKNKEKSPRDFLHRNLMYDLNDITHYSWDLILNMLDFKGSEKIYEEIVFTLDRTSSHLKEVKNWFEELEKPPGESLREEDNERIDKLTDIISEYARKKNDRAATVVTLLTDLVHLEITVVQFQNHVRQYIENRS